MITLFHKAPAPYHTSVPLVVTLTAVLGGFWAFAMAKAVAIRRKPVTVGPQQIVGMEGIARGEDLVFVRGELWRARRSDGGDLVPGDHVQVEGVDGLELTVR